MAKVTSKLQITIPKHLARAIGIEPGDEVDWSATGGSLHLSPSVKDAPTTRKRRLEIFDQATARQRERERSSEHQPEITGRGWTREDLYDRGRPR